MRRYGWRPSPPDHRDYIYEPKLRGNLPAFASVRRWMPPVRDQGSLGACTAFAVCAAISALDRKLRGEDRIYSPLYLYWHTRYIEGTVNEDSGAYLRDAIKAAARFGVAEESVHPYDISRFREQPPPEAYENAYRDLIDCYEAVKDLYGVRAAIAEGYPVIFGFAVPERFETETARTGFLPPPSPDERIVGGHAVVAVAYSDRRKAILVQNSWGESFGKRGWFWLSYDYFTMGLAMDAWVIKGR